MSRNSRHFCWQGNSGGGSGRKRGQNYVRRGKAGAQRARSARATRRRGALQKWHAQARRRRQEGAASAGNKKALQKAAVAAMVARSAARLAQRRALWWHMHTAWQQVVCFYGAVWYR